MPKSTLSAGRLYALFSAPPSAEALDSLRARSKAEIGPADGDALPVEVTPDRLDLLSEGGLALHLQGLLGEAKGLHLPGPDPSIARETRFEQDPSVGPQRPFLRGFVARSPDPAGIDAGLLGEAVRFQEILHATVGLDRRSASLGLYPYDRVGPTFRYTREPIDGLRFRPLGADSEVPAAQFLAEHPLAARYAELGRSEDGLLTLRSGSGQLLSLPPILNAGGSGEVRVGDRSLLVESTGTRLARVREALGLMAVVFASRGWSITPVPGAPLVDGEDEVATGRRIHLAAAQLAEVAGRSFDASAVEHRLAESRLSARAGRQGWEVEVPPWRPDLLQGVDLIEEVVLAEGVRPEEGRRPPSRTLGRRSPERLFYRRAADLLVGSGFSEVFTPVLVSGSATVRLGRDRALTVANPVSEQYDRLRDALQISLVDTLARNVRAGYPQRFFEVGPVLFRDSRAESGATTAWHLGGCLAGEGAGFAEAASITDYLLASLAGPGLREPLPLPATIPGRSARVRLAGVPVAEIGELHPEVLSALKVPVPVVWFELDLTALWPLTGAQGPG
jgi:phenylalanyl-tRNA synthetase beta chain